MGGFENGEDGMFGSVSLMCPRCRLKTSALFSHERSDGEERVSGGIQSCFE